MALANSNQKINTQRHRSKNGTLHMTRCEYDAVFYRVFCITLLAIAFTFTVILTNVFIDIDGLLTKQGKHKEHTNNNIIKDEFTSDPNNNEDFNYIENEDLYRTKRSAEGKNFLFHIKNPKIKNVLTNRLSTLLEALDAQEPQKNKFENDLTKKPKDEDVEVKDAGKDYLTVIDDTNGNEKVQRDRDEDMLHLTMHNILLQGIIGHMNLDDVYGRVNSLMKTLSHGEESGTENNPTGRNQHEDSDGNPKITSEDKFVAELIRCNHIQDHIVSRAMKSERSHDHDEHHAGFNPSSFITLIDSDDGETVSKNSPFIGLKNKLGPKVLIKTMIEIKSPKNETISKDNINGMLELIFNGKTMKFSHPDIEIKEDLAKKSTLTHTDILEQPNQPQPVKDYSNRATLPPFVNLKDLKNIPKGYFNRFVSEYFKHFPKESNDTADETKVKYESKRHKRNIKLKYNKDENASSAAATDAPKHKKKSKKGEDDEVYVEIETHFDSKSMKGEKKKKLIKGLIDKIEKAIHSEDKKKHDDDDDGKKKKNTKLHVKKRYQDPIKKISKELTKQSGIPINNIMHRQQDSFTIPKTSRLHDNSFNVRDKSGDAWRKENIGPAFLAASKSINSAEMGELDVDYKKILDVNGIPQRLQKPLNTDMSEETMNPSTIYDLGNMKYFLKDIVGSGFSIGYNQYVDEQPDPEAIKLFTGLENVIKAYHQNYDQAQNLDQNSDINWQFDDKPGAGNNEHTIVRRSISRNPHYHKNAYKNFYDENLLPYDNYKDIFDRDNSLTNQEIPTVKVKKLYEHPIIVDETILDKELKPAEIFSLANLLERKKRSISVKKISNIKSKIKLNRYLNTKAMSNKKLFQINKRNKRQINKIRIIASDVPHKHTSDENVFLVSDENIFADRAIVKEVETAEAEPEKQEETEYYPYPDDDNSPTYRIFEKKSRQNPLMSKYPHIFMEEISKSKEDYGSDISLLFGKIPTFNKRTSKDTDDKIEQNVVIESMSTPEPVIVIKSPDPDEKTEGEHDTDNTLPKSDYKVTVKITPKNITTGLHSGFKEIHTSINKRFNKNGLLYSSLVNVSEISKVINVNKSKTPDYHHNKAPTDTDVYLTKKIKDQQDKMQLLLREHQKRIDEQLHRLNEERSNIEAVLVDNNNTVVPHYDYLDVVSPPKSHRVLHLSKDDVQKISGISLQMQETTTITGSPTTITNPITITTTPPTTPPTTSRTTPPTTAIVTEAPTLKDKIKENLINSIERNQNMTELILKKIDKNTEILQEFLKKLTVRMEIQRPPEYKNPNVEDFTEKPMMKIEPNHFFPLDWRNHPVIPFAHHMLVRKNDSHMSIPFVYAYQQPIMPHKNPSPIANIIYHGHIHANTIHPKDISTSEHEKLHQLHKALELKNETHFFIDELENDYKVIPVDSIKKQMLHNNSTTT